MKFISFLIAAFLIAGLNIPIHARYYDAPQGRFISPDSIIPNERDPQSLNRYAYVRNNPANLTDPTGHSWLSSTFNKANNWINHNSFGVGMVLQNFDLLSGSALLAQTRQGQNYMAAQLIGATAVGAFVAGGVAQGLYQSAFWGEINGGYSAYQDGGNIISGVLVGGAIGLGTGYLSRSIGTSAVPDTQGSWKVVDGKVTQEIASPNYVPLESATQKFFKSVMVRSLGQGVVNGAGAGAISSYAGGKGSITNIGSGTLRGAIRGAAISGVISGVSHIGFKPTDLRGDGFGVNVDDSSGLRVTMPLRLSVNRGFSAYSYSGTFHISNSQDVLTTGFREGQISFEALPTPIYWLAR